MAHTASQTILSRPDNHDNERVQPINKWRQYIPRVVIPVCIHWLHRHEHCTHATDQSPFVFCMVPCTKMDMVSMNVTYMPACRTSTRAGKSRCLLMNGLIIELSEECRMHRPALDISMAMLAWLEYRCTNQTAWQDSWTVERL